jgi:hypothetical protein
MAHKTANSLLIAALFLSIRLVAPADYIQAQSAPSSNDATLMVMMSRQPDAPLYVTQMFETQDMLAAVTVKNRSSKNIVSYQLGWSIAFPPSATATRFKPVVTLGPLDQAQIAPGAKSTARNYRLWITELENLAAAHNVKALRIQLGVIAVNCADGSHWNFDLAANKAFEPDPVDSPNPHCPAPSTPTH